MVIMFFDERLNVKVGRGYRAIMWIEDHTDTERVKEDECEGKKN